MGKREMDGPNPSNPFTTDARPIKHIPGIIEYPFGTINVSDDSDERLRLLDSFKGKSK